MNFQQLEQPEHSNVLYIWFAVRWILSLTLGVFTTNKSSKLWNVKVLPVIQHVYTRPSHSSVYTQHTCAIPQPLANIASSLKFLAPQKISPPARNHWHLLSQSANETLQRWQWPVNPWELNCSKLWGLWVRWPSNKFRQSPDSSFMCVSAVCVLGQGVFFYILWYRKGRKSLYNTLNFKNSEDIYEFVKYEWTVKHNQHRNGMSTNLWT